MTSLELVEFINSERAEGEAELRHDSFMAKVPKVLGGVQNLLDTYIHPQNGQTYSCYRFPKREACLMAMSYSYELQAKVFDRMTELEAKQAPAPLPLTSSQQNTRDAADWMCKMLNIEGSAKVAVAEYALKLTAPEMIPMLPAYAIDAPRTTDGKLISSGEGSSLTCAPVSDLLKKFSVAFSPANFNKLLLSEGFLEVLERKSTSQPGAVRSYKAVSAKGLAYGKNLVNPKAQGETQPYWFHNTFPQLLKELNV